MKSILLINHYAGSLSMGMEFRPYYLAKEWIKAGHNVCIVTASYSHLRQNNPLTKKTGDIQEIDGISYYWIKTNKYESNGIARFMSIIKFCISIMLSTKKIVRMFSPDFVISSSTYPFDIFPAKKIADLSNAKLIHELHDMWPLSLIELGGMNKNHFFVKLVKEAEQYVYRHIDAEISILANTKDYMVRNGLSPEKFFHVPNGIDFNANLDRKELRDTYTHLLETLRNKEKFICCFFGSHTKSYGLDLLIKAKQNYDDISLVYVGDGFYKKELIKYAEDLGTEGVYFLDSIPKNEIQSLLEKVDCVYVGTNGSQIFKFGISMNKLYDAMYSGKPIILAANSPNNIVQISQCGEEVYPIDSINIAKALIKLRDLNNYEREKIGQKGRSYVKENCNYEKLAADFLKILETI